MLKRSAALLCAMALLALCLPALSFADETVFSFSFSGAHINPLGAGSTAGRKSDLRRNADPPAFNDASQAAAYLRGRLAARETPVAYTLYVSGKVTEEAKVRAVIEGVWDEALDHTGEPAEGDYLRWQYGYAHWSVDGGYAPASDRTRLTVTYDPVSYYTSAVQEAQTETAADALLGEIITAGMSDAEKIRAIYAWVCDHVKYDYEHDDSYKLKYTAYAALTDNCSVCQGYALLIYRLLLACGIDNRVVVSENHAWNLVRLDGEYYYLDATMDAGNEIWEWFLIGEKTLKKQNTDGVHTVTSPFIDDYKTDTDPQDYYRITLTADRTLLWLGEDGADSAYMNVTVSDGDPYSGTYTWKMSHSGIVSLVPFGTDCRADALKAGKVTVTVIREDGKTASVKLTVRNRRDTPKTGDPADPVLYAALAMLLPAAAYRLRRRARR